jgi:AcrR family transcriptional regulator
MTRSAEYVATGRYRGAAAVERRAERRQRLLDAAFELLGTAGWGGTTVRGVCEAARLNPRYFYESFADLEELVAAVLKQVAGETTEVVVAAFEAAPNDVESKARATIEAGVIHLTEDPRRAKVLFMEALGNEALARHRLDTMHAISGLLATYARHFYGEQDSEDPISEITAGLLVGGGVELMISWIDGRLAVSREQLIDDLTALWVATGEAGVAIGRSRKGKA